LDASAAVKLVLQERGSEQLRSYFANRASFYITSVCLAEALGVFKRKRLRDEISEKQYVTTLSLAGLPAEFARIRVDEIELSSLDTFSKAEEIARRHKLDLSDSLQLVSVKHGTVPRTGVTPAPRG
jgi:predicted nucleic acid-binding protein